MPAYAAPAVRLQSKEEYIRYCHACLGYPAKATLVRALKLWLSVPGLTAADVKKDLPNIVNTALGHLDATLKNIQSTKAKPARSAAARDQSPQAIWMADHMVTGRDAICGPRRFFVLSHLLLRG